MKQLFLILIALSLTSIAEAQNYYAYASWVGQNDSSPITNTTSTSFKTATSGLRHYITDISCVNDSGVASRVKLLCGTTVVWAGYLAATTGSDGQSFSIPKRCGVNEAVNVQLATTSTSTICAVGGYSSTW